MAGVLGLDALGWIQAGLGLLGVFEQQKLEEEANRANEARFQEARRLNEQQQRMQFHLRNRAMKEARGQLKHVEGAFAQREEDIKRRGEKLADRISGQQINRGLGAVTSAGYTQAAVERETGRALGDLTGEKSRTMLEVGMLPTNIDLAATAQMQNLIGQDINLLASREDVPGLAPALAYSQLLGGFRPPPEAPEPPSFGENLALAATEGTFGVAGAFFGRGG